MLQEALAEIELEKAEKERKEAEVQEKLDGQFGKLSETGQLTPPGAQAPAVVLQEPLARMEEAQEGEDDEMTLHREARGTTPINLDLSRLHMTMPECHVVTSPVPVIMLPPLPEQVVVEETPMAAPLAQEQVVPEEIAPKEAEMGEEEVLEERPVIDNAELLLGHHEEELSAEDRAKLEDQRQRWAAEDSAKQQKEQDAQIALHLQDQ